MLTPEERRVLGYLQTHGNCRPADVGQACLPGAAVECFERVLSDLEWRGYVVVYYDRQGRAIALQTTEQGMRCRD